MSGDYSLTALLFANPNYQPPTEMPLGDFSVAKGETTEFALGAVAFNVAAELKEAPVEARPSSRTALGRETRGSCGTTTTTTCSSPRQRRRARTAWRFSIAGAKRPRRSRRGWR